MQPLVQCYTLSESEIKLGLDAYDYDSVIAESPLVQYAAVTLVPVLRPVKGLTVETAALSVSFIHGYESCEHPDHTGSILSFAPDQWRLLSDKTHLILLDPAGLSGNALLYAPENSGIILENTKDKTSYLTIGKDAVPSIVKRNRASMMLEALTASQPTAPVSRKGRQARQH